MDFTLTYDLDDAGWAYLDIEDDGSEANITISYLRDSLRELAVAAKEFVEGAKSAEVVFLAEPGITTLILNRTGDVLGYELRWFGGYDDSERSVLMSGKTTPTRFVSEVKKELKSLYEVYGEALYAQRWMDRFPTDLMRELTRMDDIKQSLEKMKRCEAQGIKLSESDTQVLLVEELLSIAGYDILDPFIVRRASRDSAGSCFDVEVYREDKLFLAIEVKSLSSVQFNVDKKHIGKIKNKNDKWQNNDGDGVGQLRAYCLNWRDKLTSDTIPILTNGDRWCLFSSAEFLDEEKTGDIIQIEECAITGSIKDRDFEEKIIQLIRCLNS